MIRSRNPRIDVAQLENQIAEELAREPGAGDDRLARLAAQVHVRTIEAQLAHAEQRSAPRNTWPDDLRIFPFQSRGLRSFALRVLRLAFRDQQEVNAALIRSARESLALVQALSERVAELEARIERERASERARVMEQRRERSDDGT